MAKTTTKCRRRSGRSIAGYPTCSRYAQTCVMQKDEAQKGRLVYKLQHEQEIRHPLRGRFSQEDSVPMSREDTLNLRASRRRLRRHAHSISAAMMR